MRGMVKFNLMAAALCLAVASGAAALSAVNGVAAGNWSLIPYFAALVFLLTAAGVWLKRRYWTRRVYADPRPTVSGNSIRRRLRGRRTVLPEFIEPLGVNREIRLNSPEKVAQVQACDHPDYVQGQTPRIWHCVACPLTVINDRKPRPGRRAIA